MRPIAILILILPILTTSKVFANKTKKQIDSIHTDISNRVLNMSESIDNFFAGGKHDSLPNKSKLKLSFKTYFREAAGPYIIPDINYQLVLPRTQKRLQLFIENEDEDKKSGTSDTATVGTANRRESDEESTIAAGVRYVTEITGIKMSTDTGIILGIPTKVFGKLTFKRNVLFDKWILKINEQLKWVNTEGFSSDLDLDFDRTLSKGLLFRFVNNIAWNDEDYIVTFENGPTLIQTLSKRSAISYHAHVITVNKPEFVVDNYTLQASYRRRVYKRWFYAQITPFINFPRINNFHRTPGLLLKLDAIFGNL